MSTTPASNPRSSKPFNLTNKTGEALLNLTQQSLRDVRSLRVRELQGLALSAVPSAWKESYPQTKVGLADAAGHRLI